jgi:hypothetical protein
VHDVDSDVTLQLFPFFLSKQQLFVHLLNHPPDERGSVKDNMEITPLFGPDHIVIVRPLSHSLPVYLANLFNLVLLPVLEFKPERSDMMLYFGLMKPPYNV